jgi:hypothetical protein
MSLRNGRTHYFHADATAIGGYIVKPFVKDIPVQAPTALSPSGGHDEASTVNFQFEDILSAKATRTRVEGHFLGELATTRMTAVVEDLNILDKVRADELVAYISTEHPGKEPDVPRVNFGRTRITDLRVGDSVLEVQLDLNLLNNGNRDGFPKIAPVYDKTVWNKVKQKFDEERGFLQCSLVKEIEVVRGKLPGKLLPPNIIEIPDFGRVHVAELLITGDSYELIMLRIELGCPTQGTASASAGAVNGKGGP